MATLDLSEGTLFAGDYRIVAPLAKGGMGSVYVAEQVSTGRRRAIKVMHPSLVTDDKMVSRFIQEAKVGSLVDSDHVVEVIAAGVDDKNRMPWLCMELLEGETLEQRIQRSGALSPVELKEVAIQLRHALFRAHEKGLVHRDLKPENIFLERARRSGVPFTVKILDFGISKLVQQAKGRQASGTQSIGSPLWMAPEQANAHPISPATDVWALGLIAFMSLTGRIYWKTAATAGELHLTRLLVEILVDPMSTASERARELAAQAIPGDGFDLWLSRCLARDATERFPEAGGCLDALVGVLSTDVLRKPTSIPATASISTAPTALASPLSPIDTSAKTAAVEETFEPIIGAPIPMTAAPPTGPKKSGVGIGQIAALLAGSVLVALMAVFGGVAGVGLFAVGDEADASPPADQGDVDLEMGESPFGATGPGTESSPMPPFVPSFDPPPPPPPQTDPRQPPPDVTSTVVPLPGRNEDIGVVQIRRPPRQSGAARVFHESVVQQCWQDELASHPHPTPTRIEFVLVMRPDRRRVENVRLPQAWHGTPFARCVVARAPSARFEQPPDQTSFTLTLPASR